MGMLDNLLQQSKPGVNPDLENMISRLMLGSGATQGQADSSASSVAGGGSQQPGALGTGAAAVPSPAGGAQPMQPDQANLTYQALIRKGVPEPLAKQAMSNPQLLKQLLGQLYQASGPQEVAPQGPSATQTRPSAPPLGGGSGY